MVATLVASAVGLPLMIALTYAVGPVGTAIGYGATELIATVWMIRRYPARLPRARRGAGRDGRPGPRLHRPRR